MLFITTYHKKGNHCLNHIPELGYLVRGRGRSVKKVAPIFEFFPLCYYIMDEPIKTKVMINNKALVYSYVAKMFADGTKYHESIKESDNIGYIYDAVEELLKTKLSEQEKE